MMYSLPQYRKQKGGFTLVELIVVLVILALLALILVPSLTGWIDQSKKTRAIAACRSCVNAAQTLVSNEHAFRGELTVPSDEAVRALAGVDQGSVSGIALNQSKSASSLNNANTDESIATVNILTYTDESGLSVFYLRKPSPHYIVNKPLSWSKGVVYQEGDLMIADGYIFHCLKTHTSGSRSNTRNPSVKSNKGSWEVVGFAGGGPPPYTAVVRFSEGVVVSYNGKLYARTSYNLTGGQTPYSKSSSRYWILQA